MEKLMNYNEFLSEYIYKKFGPLDREILVRDLGIDNDTFCDAIKNYAKLSKKKQVAITVLISKIKNMINNEVLLRELLGRIIFICSYGKVMEVSNSFKGIYQDKNNTYSVEIHLEDNKINSYAKSNIGYSNITYEKK